MATDYIVRLKCPYGDRDELLMLENREENLKQILETSWDFECPVHGVQREMPLEGNQKSLWRRSEPPRRQAEAQAKAVERVGPKPRSSTRISLHVPVLVYGWSNLENSFHEEATTLLVNASGGLLALNSRVALGDTVFLTNKATQQEQECRVVYVGKDARGKAQVGVAFKRQAPHFWRGNRRESRMAKQIRVKVEGKDRHGNSFVQNTYAVDISRHGARLEGIGMLTWPGETIVLKRSFRSARFRVVWVGEVGTPHANQAGILALEPNSNLWGVTLP
jgi:hypothetical protein